LKGGCAHLKKKSPAVLSAGLLLAGEMRGVLRRLATPAAAMEAAEHTSPNTATAQQQDENRATCETADIFLIVWVVIFIF
jgi:hypothetical protein